MENISLKIVRLDKNLPLPQYAYPGDSAMDLRSRIAITIEPRQRCLVPTGIALEIPYGYGGLVLPRSGLALKNGISVVNSPGLIDPNYRGEISAILLNTSSDASFEIKVGDRIAQFCLVKFPQISLKEVSELDSTNREGAGFGSSGV